MKRFIVVGRSSIIDQIKNEDLEATDALDAARQVSGFKHLEIVPGCDRVDGVTIVRALAGGRPFLMYVLERDARD